MVVVPISHLHETDVDALRGFLTDVDLTVAGLDEPAVHLWVERDEHGEIVGSTGIELSADGRHALVRSVAVAPGHRGSGRGARLAEHALAEAAARGATGRGCSRGGRARSGRGSASPGPTAPSSPRPCPTPS